MLNSNNGSLYRSRIFLIILVLGMMLAFPLKKGWTEDRFDFGDLEPEIFGAISPNLLSEPGLNSGYGGGIGFLYIPYFFNTTRIGVRGHFSYLSYPTYGSAQSSFNLMPVTAGMQLGLTHFEDDKHDFLYIFGDGGMTLGGQTGSNLLFDTGIGFQWDRMFIEMPFVNVFNGYPHLHGAGASNLQDVMIMIGFDL